VVIGLRYFHWYRSHDFRPGGWASELGNIHFSQVDGIVVENGRKVGKKQRSWKWAITADLAESVKVLSMNRKREKYYTKKNNRQWLLKAERKGLFASQVLALATIVSVIIALTPSH